MTTAHLRVFRPEEEVVEEQDAPSIPVRLADLYPILTKAFHENYSWLRDFEDETLMVSPDLHEVIRAFSNYRPSA